MAEEIDELKKLPVEERIKRLKELEKKNKDEIKKAQSLLRETEDEAEEKEKEKLQTPIPQVKAADINELLTAEEKQMFNAKTFKGEKPKKEEVLEDTVVEEGKKLEPEIIEQAQQQYQNKITSAPAADMYKEMKQISYDIQKTGEVTSDQMYKIQKMEEAAEKRLGDESYNPSEYAANKLSAIGQIGEELKRKYKG